MYKMRTSFFCNCWSWSNIYIANRHSTLFDIFFGLGLDENQWVFMFCSFVSPFGVFEAPYDFLFPYSLADSKGSFATDAWNNFGDFGAWNLGFLDPSKTECVILWKISKGQRFNLQWRIKYSLEPVKWRLLFC